MIFFPGLVDVSWSVTQVCLFAGWSWYRDRNVGCGIEVSEMWKQEELRCAHVKPRDI